MIYIIPIGGNAFVCIIHFAPGDMLSEEGFGEKNGGYQYYEESLH
jgi:hypothetical protein